MKKAELVRINRRLKTRLESARRVNVILHQKNMQLAQMVIDLRKK